MTLTSYEKYGLKEVINASGKMTILGVSRVSEKVREVQSQAGDSFFEMSDLIKKTGSYIAELLGAEDSLIVSSASAGIAQSIAAIIGKGSEYHLYHPYDSSFGQREIIIPKGHNVDYGTAVEVMVAQGGGNLIEAGYANMCTPAHIDQMISKNTGAILYIKSHHTVQKSMLNVEEAINVARKQNVPLIVDAAAEEDLKKYIELGVDLVIYSGAKAIEGPSSGLVVGKKKYIEWVRMQGSGLGRSMKIGKENILGFAQAIEDYLKFGSESGAGMKRRLEPFLTELNKIPGIHALEAQDGAGRDIYRAKIVVSGVKSARNVIEELKGKSPAIYTREYQANNGIIEFDIRSVDQREMTMIVTRLQEIMKE